MRTATTNRIVQEHAGNWTLVQTKKRRKVLQNHRHYRMTMREIERHMTTCLMDNAETEGAMTDKGREVVRNDEQ